MSETLEKEGKLEPRTVGSLMRDPVNATTMRVFFGYSAALFVAPAAVFVVSGHWIEDVETRALLAIAAVLLVLGMFVLATIREEVALGRVKSD